MKGQRRSICVCPKMESLEKQRQNGLKSQMLYVLHAPVYGQANAPRQWFLHVLDVMVNKLQWAQHSLDPCIFLKKVNREVKAVLGIHVDDILAASLQEASSLKLKSFSVGAVPGRSMILSLSDAALFAMATATSL